MSVVPCIAADRTRVRERQQIIAMQQLDNGHFVSSVSLPEDLAEQIQERLEQDPELTESRFFREAARNRLSEEGKE